MWPLSRVPARGCYGRDDNRLKSQLRKGQREVEGACEGAAGVKGGFPLLSWKVFHVLEQ